MPTSSNLRLLLALAAVTLLALVLGVAKRFDPLPQGLHAEYFSDTAWTAPPRIATLDSQPSTSHLVEAWRGSPPETFSTTWAGSILILSDGTYTLATVSDDGSSVFVDGRLVVDNGGRHGAQLATGSVHLAGGVHALSIRYVQEGGAFHFEFLWGQPGQSLEPVPAWALRPRKVSLARLAPSVLLGLSLAMSKWIWVGTLLLVCAAAIRPLVRRLKSVLEQSCDWGSLRSILAGSLLLNLMGLWWGLPGSWVQIELTPGLLADGLGQHFSHGWFDAYPPLHFYILTIATSPMLLLQALGLVDIYAGGDAYTVLVVITRLVSLAAGVGTVIATCLCGTQAFGRRAGVFAAAMFAAVTPFVYYAKTANVDVPYIFWWALSLVFYLRLLDGLRLQDFVLFAACATFSVCTKDQAYALYLLAPPVIIEQLWRVNRRAGLSHPFWRALFDRRLLAGAMTAAVCFAVIHNLLFNSAGFLDHVRFIVGPGSENYRVFEPTASGHLALLRVSAHLVEVSMGWPLFLVGVAGLLAAATRAPLRRMTAWLTMPIASYYFGFINVILYNYDRFVLPICFVLALFGGFALDAFLMSSKGARRWRIVGVTTVFAYTLLYAGTVDVLMLGDSRYVVESWMKMHVQPGDVVGISGVRELLPRLDEFQQVDIGTIEKLQSERPRYFVLNADYARAVPSDTSWGQLISGLQQDMLGYRLALRFRRSSPWPWLPGGHQDLVGARQETVVFSTLRNINPTIEVFQRDDSDSGGRATHDHLPQ